MVFLFSASFRLFDVLCEIINTRSVWDSLGKGLLGGYVVVTSLFSGFSCYSSVRFQI